MVLPQILSQYIAVPYGFRVYTIYTTVYHNSILGYVIVYYSHQPTLMFLLGILRSYLFANAVIDEQLAWHVLG